MTWQIPKAGRDFEFSEALSPLAKHRENLTVLSGLHHPNGMGAAHVCGDLWLTGAKLDTNQRSVRNSVSCDQLMAEVTSAHTRFPSLELSVAAGTGQPNASNTLAFSRDGVPLPAEENAQSVFIRLFVADAGGAKAEADRRRWHSTRTSPQALAMEARATAAAGEISAFSRHKPRTAPVLNR